MPAIPKLTEGYWKCPEACSSILDSTAVPEGSGRPPEACSEAYGKHGFVPHPEGSGRAEEACREMVNNGGRCELAL